MLRAEKSNATITLIRKRPASPCGCIECLILSPRLPYVGLNGNELLSAAACLIGHFICPLCLVVGVIGNSPLRRCWRAAQELFSLKCCAPLARSLCTYVLFCQATDFYLTLQILGSSLLSRRILGSCAITGTIHRAART